MNIDFDLTKANEAIKLVFDGKQVLLRRECVALLGSLKNSFSVKRRKYIESLINEAGIELDKSIKFCQATYLEAMTKILADEALAKNDDCLVLINSRKIIVENQLRRCLASAKRNYKLALIDLTK